MLEIQQKSGIGFRHGAKAGVWRVWSEESANDKRLVRLCLGHSAVKKYFILETYYPDEIEKAMQDCADYIKKSIRILRPTLLNKAVPPIEILDAIPTSRSTREFHNSLNFNRKGFVFPIVSISL